MTKGFFGFWWCLVFAVVSGWWLIDAIAREEEIYIWINSIALILWLFFAWNENRRDALEAETKKNDDDNKDNWSPPNGSSSR